MHLFTADTLAGSCLLWGYFIALLILALSIGIFLLLKFYPWNCKL